MIYAKPATSLLVVFRAYLASDHVTPATGKTIAITISKNGGAFGNPNAGATNATEISSGFYKVTLDTTDTGTAGPLAVRGAVATVDDVGVLYYVGQAPADVTHFGGTAATTSGGRPEVNTSHLAGTAYGSADLSATMKASVNTEADTALSDYGALKPTVAGRTLDVSAGGEGGVDWANVGSPTTTVGLSGTTVKTATDVETDTADIQARLPATLGANGNIKADVFDFGGTAGTNSGGRPEVNTTHLAGTAYATARAALVQAVWDALTTALTTAGSIGKRLSDEVTAARMAALTDWIDGGRLDLLLDAVKAKTDNLPADPADASDIAALIDALPTAAENAAALLDLSNGIETSITPRQAIRLILASAAGKLSGAATTTVTIRNVGDSKDRITATVDSSGNRTALTLDAT